NDGPEAADDNAATDYRTAITINVLANDSDLDGDSLTIDGVSGLSHGTVEIVDGQLVYTPTDEFSGEETFTYTISDGNGGSTTATVTVDVAAGTVFSDGDDNVDFNQLSAENYQDGQQYASGDGADTVTLADADAQAEHGFDGGEQFSAGAGNDTIIGGDGADNVDGGADNDLISGGAGDDILAGGAGDDTITGGSGNDTITGGDGAGDRAIYSGNRADYTVIGNEDGSYTIIDNVAGRDGSDQVWGIESFQFADGTIGIDDLIPEEMFTENGENVILPNADADYGTTESYDALGGDDTVTGGDLADDITGGEGNDTLSGGAGDDVLTGDGYGGNTLTVRLGGEAYQGDPHYQIKVNGEVVAEGDVTWSNNGTYGSMDDVVWQDVAVTLPDGIDPSTIEIEFTNDRYVRGSGDRNLIVDSITYNGTVLEAETDGDYVDNYSGERMPWGGTMSFDVSGVAANTESGNDELSGGAGSDTLIGGGGDDLLTGGAGNDTLSGGDGSDVAVFSGNYADYQVVQNQDGSFTITDTVDGRDGTDIVTDVESFQFGDVTYSAGQLVEMMGQHIIGDNHENTLTGGLGGDTIEARSDDDTVFGGGGDDVIFGGSGDDRIDAGDGDDYVDGGNHEDSIDGGAGNDIIDGGNHDDIIHGGAGDDHLRGNHGTDTIFGGSGNDTIYLEGNASRDQYDHLDGGEGIDTVKALNDGDMTFDGFYGNNSIEVVDGGSSASKIKGNNSANTLDFSNTTLINISEIDAGRGNDTVTGSAGDDSIDGGDNNDTVRGGAGNDTIDGGAHDDILFGDEGNDILRGGHGNDTLYGGDGDDTLVLEGRADRDQYDELHGGDGTDTVMAANDGDLIFDNFSADNSIEVVHGGNSASQVEGNNNANNLDFSNSTLVNISRIDAGRGDDTVTGTAGDDTIYGGDGNDTISGGAGDDHLEGGHGNDLFIFKLGGGGNDSISGGDGWTDTVRMEGVDSGPSEGANASWTLHLDQGEIVEQGVDEDGKEYIRLTEDASGHIETSDGEHVEFTGVERFEW
ncbi:MAG: Ig-like domain-containing protein, partial [Rhodospirillales bacterium]